MNKKVLVLALVILLGLVIIGGSIYGISQAIKENENTLVGPKGDTGPTGPEGPEGPEGPTGPRGSTIWKRDITSNGNETISIPTPVVHNMRVGDLLITTDNYVYRIYIISTNTITLTLEIAFNPPTPPEVPKWELLYTSQVYYNEFQEVDYEINLDLQLDYTYYIISFFGDYEMVESYIYYNNSIYDIPTSNFGSNIQIFDNFSIFFEVRYPGNILIEILGVSK